MIYYFYTDDEGLITFRGNVSVENDIVSVENNTLHLLEAPNEYTHYINNVFSYVPSRLEVELEVKTRRLQLLGVSDWTQGNDTPLSEEDVQKWKEYRQQLRDITDQEGYPFNVVWPIKP